MHSANQFRPSMFPSYVSALLATFQHWKKLPIWHPTVDASEILHHMFLPLCLWWDIRHLFNDSTAVSSGISFFSNKKIVGTQKKHIFFFFHSKIYHKNSSRKPPLGMRKWNPSGRVARRVHWPILEAGDIPRFVARRLGTSSNGRGGGGVLGSSKKPTGWLVDVWEKVDVYVFVMSFNTLFLWFVCLFFAYLQMARMNLSSTDQWDSAFKVSDLMSWNPLFINRGRALKMATYPKGVKNSVSGATKVVRRLDKIPGWPMCFWKIHREQNSIHKSNFCLKRWRKILTTRKQFWFTNYKPLIFSSKVVLQNCGFFYGDDPIHVFFQMGWNRTDHLVVASPWIFLWFSDR